MMNYNPSLTSCGNFAMQTVKLVFGIWEYRLEMEVKVGGNCRGLSVLTAAVSNAWDKLEYRVVDGEEITNITLRNAAGDELFCEDEEAKGEDWLEDMLISAEIVSIEPQIDE